MREAHAHDASELTRLRTRIEAELRGTRSGDLLLDSEAISHSRTRNHLTALVELEGVPVGFCEAHVSDPGEPHCRCVVGAFFVEPEARGVGAGELLMDHVVEWAARTGCRGIDVVALPGSREAKSFFESSGFVARLIVMHRRLEGE